MKFTMMSAKNVHKYLELIESFVASQADIFVEDSYKWYLDIFVEDSYKWYLDISILFNSDPYVK